MRLIFVGVPQFLLHSREAPENLQSYTEAWWLQLLWLFIFACGNVFFFAVYASIIGIWTQAYAAATDQSMAAPSRSWFLFRLALALYSLSLATTLGLFFRLPIRTIIIIISGIRCFISVGIASVFLVAFRRLHSALSPHGDGAAHSLLSSYAGEGASAAVQAADEARNRKLASIRLVAIVCVVGLLFRGAGSAYTAWSASTDAAHSQLGYSIFISMYYVTCEVIPSFMILYILRRPSAARGQQPKGFLARFTPGFLRKSVDAAPPSESSMQSLLHTNSNDGSAPIPTGRSATAPLSVWSQPKGSPSRGAWGASSRGSVLSGGTAEQYQRVPGMPRNTAVGSLTTHADSFTEQMAAHSHRPQGMPSSMASQHHREKRSHRSGSSLVLGGGDSPQPRPHAGHKKTKKKRNSTTDPTGARSRAASATGST